MLFRHRNIAGGDDKKSLGSNLVEEQHVFPGRIVAGPVAPHQDGQGILFAERGQVRRDEDGVCFQPRILQHQRFVWACPAFFQDTGLCGRWNDWA